MLSAERIRHVVAVLGLSHSASLPIPDADNHKKALIMAPSSIHSALDSASLTGDVIAETRLEPLKPANPSTSSLISSTRRGSKLGSSMRSDASSVYSITSSVMTNETMDTIASDRTATRVRHRVSCHPAAPPYQIGLLSSSS